SSWRERHTACLAAGTSASTLPPSHRPWGCMS
ncbi:hypothetical protein MCGFDL_MCGFDL_03145, partial [Dysosmobacter welbionis]